MFCRFLVVLLAFACCASPLSAWSADESQPTYLTLGTAAVWKRAELPGSYLYVDQKDRQWSVKLKPEGKNDEGQPKVLRMTVSADGVKAMATTLDIDATADYGSLAVYDFDAEHPVFLMTNYTMGAHCCIAAQAISFTDDKLVAVDVGSFDGSDLSVRDLDGDGTYEIESWDQRFYYAFDSYAGSLPARRILKIRDKLDDVTDDPPYQRYLYSEINHWLPECINNPGPGVCAGVLGTAAKAGLYQSVAAAVPFKAIDDANKDADYLNCSADVCGTEMKFWNYAEMLEFQLNQWGYVTDSAMNDKVRAYYRKLAEARGGFGLPAKDSEMACGMGPVKISMDKKEQFAEVEGYEYACRIEKADLLGDAAIGLGLCSGEGERWSTLVATELKGDKLYMTTIFNEGVNSNAEPLVLERCR